jgi:hypothetical protein
MEIATWHTGKLMITDHYNSMWTPQPCKCLHHTWAELHPAQPFKCYYCHHHYQFWHKPSVPSTQCPFLRVTEQHWMVSSQDFLRAIEWGHHIPFNNLESRKLVRSTAERKPLQWHRESEHCTVRQNLIHSLLLSVTSCFDLVTIRMSSSEPRVISRLNYMIIGYTWKIGTILI